ncbi:hypothetical protein PRZ48_011224 [Zasmidium cellare]|uniref:Xylanolytic transcriptional activator regulatory domain-containing protein n=1 Tax=Zasmidium cellare TaxID=395010 RepID=A0ABR0EBC6_ZASCE|nr:hypothetical protein PRZ48_011224 [Zasmidium cellare]
MAHSLEPGPSSQPAVSNEQGKQELINSAWTERALERLSNLPEAIQFLLDSHWCWVQPLFNFVYRPAFTRDLKTNGQFCSVLLLNAMLAHSVRWAKADQNVAHLLEPFEDGAYFGRQVRLNLMDSLQSGPPTIPTVQALLLLSAQECGQGNLTQAWLYSGMAFRLIEDLGIIFDGRKYAGALKLSTEEVEVRNRLFWSCYLWDKVMSLYLGRLPVLQESSVSPPRSILDDTSEIDIWIPHGLDPVTMAEYPPAQAYTTSCFINTCALSEILNALLVTMYNPAKESTTAEVERCAIEEEKRLGSGHHLRQCLESANAILLLFDLFCKSFGDGHVILSQAYALYTAASMFLLQVQATKDFASMAMDNLRYSVDALERLQNTSPGKTSGLVCEISADSYSVLGSALLSIYRALQELNPEIIIKHDDGSYYMSNTSGIDRNREATSSRGNVDHTGRARIGTQDANFAIPDLDYMEIPPDLFDMLPEIEPISANVNAGMGINLDQQWFRR